MLSLVYVLFKDMNMCYFSTRSQTSLSIQSLVTSSLFLGWCSRIILFVFWNFIHIYSYIYSYIFMQIVTLTISHIFARYTCDISSFKLKPRHGLKYTYFECQSIVWIFQMKVFWVPPRILQWQLLFIWAPREQKYSSWQAVGNVMMNDLPGTFWGRWD